LGIRRFFRRLSICAKQSIVRHSGERGRAARKNATARQLHPQKNYQPGSGAINLVPIVSYNAAVVKTYNATSSPVRFENKNIFFYFHKTL
jgi:hypothetical protein